MDLKVTVNGVPFYVVDDNKVKCSCGVKLTRKPTTDNLEKHLQTDSHTKQLQWRLDNNRSVVFHSLLNPSVKFIR